MRRLPFERPTEYYDDRLFSIDEQICALLKERRELSNQNPGFPPADLIAGWASKYGHYEDFLNSLFGSLRLEDQFKPRVEPIHFEKYLSILKSVEKAGRLYTITFIRQFENASVVQLNCDWHETEGEHELRHLQHERPAFLTLEMGEPYECRMDRGSGTTGQYTHTFIVTPRIPDDYSGLKLTFKEYQDPFKDEPTGLEIGFQLD
ncbi:hypothetical protein [Neobacillus muris]|uniref:hypothetical protein n=1 Tax=Neobacillus muris TaxID=2941334 RepID=UPI00203D3D6B|nr:hypothetical protein [Neobacillus muris]